MKISSAPPMLSSDDIFEGNKDFFIHLSTDYKYFENKLHSHEFVEISHIISGEAEHEIGGTKYKVHRGDLIAIRRGIPHTFRPIECDEPFVAYDLMFTENFLLQSSFGDSFDYALDVLFGRTGYHNDIHLARGAYQIFGEIFHRIYTEFRTRHSGYLDLIRAYVTELIINLFRRLEDDSYAKFSSRIKDAVRSTTAFIDENFKDHLTLEDLSSRIFFSKDYLGKAFREITGMTVVAYIQNTRLSEACRLLSETDKTVSEIAELSGFGDLKSFYTVFKRTMNTTPRKYRGE